MSSASGSRSGGPQDGSQSSVSTATTVPLAPDETCSTTSVVPVGYPSYCRATRTCRSCLEKTDCMIGVDGKCVSLFQGGYTPGGYMNYRNAFKYDLVLPNATNTNPVGLQASQQWLFPSVDAKYCPVDDAVCQRCISARFWVNSSWPDSRFCVGANGCVCISDCEDTRNVPTADCSTYATFSPSPTPSATIIDLSGLNATIKAVGVGMGGVLMLMAAFLYYCVRRDYIQRQRQDALRRSEREARATLRAQQRQQRMEEMGISMLSLSGWRTYRQSLIDKEAHRLTQGTSSESERGSTPYTLAIDDEDSNARASQQPVDAAPPSQPAVNIAPTGEARAMFMPSS